MLFIEYNNMEGLLSLIILILIGWGAIKLMIIIAPKIWFLIVFFVAAFVLIIWVAFLESSGFGVLLGIFGAIAAAWAFAKAKT